MEEATNKFQVNISLSLTFLLLIITDVGVFLKYCQTIFVSSFCYLGLFFNLSAWLLYLIWWGGLRAKMYLRKNDAVIGVTSTQEINIYFLVNQLKSTNSNKITLTYTSWSYGTLWKFPFSCSLFTSLLSPPWWFTLPHHLPHTPFFTSPSRYPKRSYHLPSSVLFIPLTPNQVSPATSI